MGTSVDNDIEESLEGTEESCRNVEPGFGGDSRISHNSCSDGKAVCEKEGDDVPSGLDEESPPLALTAGRSAMHGSPAVRRWGCTGRILTCGY